MSKLETRWAKELDEDEVFVMHPYKKLERKDWMNLNGIWRYVISSDDVYPAVFKEEVLVPFPIESALSRVGHALMPDEYLWYERKVFVNLGKRIILHFDAVDQYCKVYVNHIYVGEHHGGYTPFSFDITEYVEGNIFTLGVCVKDVTNESYYSVGKQSLDPKGIYYHGISGIWQTPWLEFVNPIYIYDLRIETQYDLGYIIINPSLNLDVPFQLHTHFINGEYEDSDELIISMPLFESWDPDHPYLYELEISLIIDGKVMDTIQTYFGMRKIELVSVDGTPKIFLNNKYIFQAGVLDQGYYPDGIYTPATDDMIIEDIKNMKKLGFNMLRKHAKVEPDRFYYYCDVYGILVWQDFVNGGTKPKSWFVSYLATVMNRFNITIKDKHPYLLSRKDVKGKEMFKKEIQETINHLYHHPCIVTYVIFNEGWGQFDTNYLTRYVRELDNTRLIDQASGWFDQGQGDLQSIHHYFFSLKLHPDHRRALVISEFGGYALKVPDHTMMDKEFGYKKFKSTESLSKGYAKLMENTILPHRNEICATVYTQWTDIEEEINGIYTYDRKALKFDEKVIQKYNNLLKNGN